MSGWTTTVAATCETSGLQVRSCEYNCGYSESQGIGATGHNWVNKGTCGAKKDHLKCNGTHAQRDVYSCTNAYVYCKNGHRSQMDIPQGVIHGNSSFYSWWTCGKTLYVCSKCQKKK